MLRLFNFFYACVNFLSWLVLEKVFEWNEIVEFCRRFACLRA
jgi:hypothetical protein